MADDRATEIWKAILGDLQLQVNPSIYETWLKDTQGLSILDNLLAVEVATPFAIEWLERRMYQSIQSTAQKIAGRPLQVQFQVRNTAPSNASESPDADDRRPAHRTIQAPQYKLNGKYNFNSFVVGPSNRLPYSAARAVAEAPGRSYNPLFIYSGVGLGKTPPPPRHRPHLRLRGAELHIRHLRAVYQRVHHRHKEQDHRRLSRQIQKRRGPPYG